MTMLILLSGYGVTVIVPVEADGAVLALAPRSTYAGFSDDGLPLLALRPRTEYDTNGLLANSDNVSITLEPYPIIFHDGSYLVYHSGDRISFHAYVFPDIAFGLSVPRTAYSGELE
jgi:hypothetical protein